MNTIEKQLKAWEEECIYFVNLRKKNGESKNIAYNDVVFYSGLCSGAILILRPMLNNHDYNNLWVKVDKIYDKLRENFLKVYGDDE